MASLSRSSADCRDETKRYKKLITHVAIIYAWREISVLLTKWEWWITDFIVEFLMQYENGREDDFEVALKETDLFLFHFITCESLLSQIWCWTG